MNDSRQHVSVLRRVSDASVAGGVLLLQRKCACGSHTGGAETCAECAKKKGVLQRRAAGPDVEQVPPIVHEVLRAPGQPLDRETRAFMEPRFGRDFSGVRVHTDARAAESARAINAHAYTVGNNVVFGTGKHQPHSEAGRRLMAHELTHVVQQGGEAPSGALSHISIRNDVAAESQAEVAELRCGTLGNLSTQPISFQRQSISTPSTPRWTTPNKAAQEGVPVELWSEQIEYQYRQRGSIVYAEAMSACRFSGGSACAKLLSSAMVMQLFSRKTEIQAAKEHERALIIRAILQGRALPHAASGHEHSRNPPVALGLLGQLPTARAAVSAGSATTAVAASEIALATTAVVGVIAILLVAAAFELWEMAKFERMLRDKGFTILDDPLQICIGGCHTEPSPTFANKEQDAWRRWPDIMQPLPQTSPRASDDERIEPRTRPTDRDVDPIPGTPPKERRRGNKCRFTPSESPLPITWRRELPPPQMSLRTIVRTSKLDLEWEGLERGAAQRKMKADIDKSRAALIPPEAVCFPYDVDPNTPFDAHHIHPLYLGGGDEDLNLCAIETGQHMDGHVRLDFQPEHYDEYVENEICSPRLSQHPIGQQYNIVDYE